MRLAISATRAELTFDFMGASFFVFVGGDVVPLSVAPRAPQSDAIALEAKRLARAKGEEAVRTAIWAGCFGDMQGASPSVATWESVADVVEPLQHVLVVLVDRFSEALFGLVDSARDFR